MKVSLIQMESIGTKQQNMQKALNLLLQATKESPDIICLSELFLYWGRDYENGIVELKELKPFQNFAKVNNVNIVLGSVALKQKNTTKTTNTAFVINRKGEIVLRYDKKYMYAVNRPDFKFDESDEVIKGNSLGIVTLDNVKVGIGICFDLRFPEYFRNLTKNGAEVIFLPAHFNLKTGSTAWDILTKARAIENQVYFCACNQTGSKVMGNTRIISFDGSIINSLDKEEGIVTAELDFGKQKSFREEFPVLKQM